LEKQFIIDDHVYVNGKKYMLNLNVYRNCHYHILNQMKVNFKNNLLIEHREFLKNRFQSLKISYTIIPHNKVLFDTQNILSIVDKVFCDALVDSGIIPDDNYKYVTYGEPKVTEIVKGKSRKVLIDCIFL